MTVKKPRAARPHFPDLPESESPFFWLAAYLRDLAQYDELKKLVDQEYKRTKFSRTVRTFALQGAACNIQRKAFGSLKHLVNAGLLLCAFPGTTVLEGGAA